LKSDIRSALREELKVQDALEPEKKKQGFYMSALLGLSEYPEAVNIDSKSSIGFTVGSTQDDLALEGAFIFSTYDLDRYTWDYKEIEQTSLQFAAKYLVPTGSLVRPVIGGVISYTMRTYADQLPFGGYYAWGGSENEVESSAIDMGVIAGVELEVSPRFAIGLDYRYMRNLTNQADSDYFRYLGFRNVEAVEEIDYQHISLIGRFTF
jgi:opacity protein-like surface antigen